MILRPASLVGLLSVLISLPLSAQTTTYSAPTGSVSPSLYVTMNLSGSGSAVLNPVVGPNCYLGMTCGFPAGYVGTYMSYSLPDGSTANLPNFNGTFFPLGNNDYEISGQASGTDSQGRTVSVDSVQATMHITCRSGRGGGCTKVYTGGTLTVTLNGTPPADTPTPTATPAGTATATATPTPVIDAPLTLKVVRIKPASAAAANGFVRLSGSFVVSADSSFDASEGLSIDLQATGFDESRTWAAGDCAFNGPVVRCVSADRLSGVTLRAHNTPPGLWTFTLYLHKLADLGPVTGPVLLTLTEASSGDSRAGTIETCTVRGTALVCK